MNFNKVIIGARLTRDPQSKQLPSNTTVCEFGLAMSRRFKTQAGEEREEVCFVDCAAFGRTGEVIAEHFTKGKAILVDGRLKFDSWEGQDGTKRSKLSVIVESFQFVGSKSDGGSGGQGRANDGEDQRPRQPQRTSAPTRPAAPQRATGKQEYQEPSPEIASDDIPFAAPTA